MPATGTPATGTPALGTPATGTPALAADGVTVRFGGLVALRDVSVDVAPGTITGLVGPNGAGKSTLFGVLSGLRRPDAGAVRLAGRDVTGRTPQARARMGLARSFQQPELFPLLTVREHLVLAYRSRHARARLWQDLFFAGSLRRPPAGETARVDELLEMLSLADLAQQRAAVLPLGTSRILEVGRALATSPSVLLLDEPLSGLDAGEAERLAAALRHVVDHEGLAMLLVEHDVAMVLSLSSFIYVLDFGAVIAGGTPEEIRADARVRGAYLGDADQLETRAPRGTP
jgi:ABC-type branched-subunit amino acid transport system ATPase component